MGNGLGCLCTCGRETALVEQFNFTYIYLQSKLHSEVCTRLSTGYVSKERVRNLFNMIPYQKQFMKENHTRVSILPCNIYK